MSNHLHSRGYHQLAVAYSRLSHRHLWPDHPALDADGAALTERIRNGNDRTMRALIERIHAGDHDAGIVALWAIHERLRALVFACCPNGVDRRSMFDDELTIAWWVLRELDPRHDHLVDRVLSRSRRRYERMHDRTTPVAADGLPDISSTIADPTFSSAAALVELRHTITAIKASTISAAEWHAFLASRIGGLRDDTRPAKGTERQAAYRARAKLRAIISGVAA